MIREYEDYIKKAVKTPTKELAAYHAEMVKNFQHERAIHLAVTLFFAALTIISVIVTTIFCVVTSELLVLIPSLLLTTILLILTICYVRHYYFLENHIQSLYHYSKLLHQ